MLLWLKNYNVTSEIFRDYEENSTNENLIFVFPVMWINYEWKVAKNRKQVPKRLKGSKRDMEKTIFWRWIETDEFQRWIYTFT